MERQNAWKNYTNDQLAELNRVADAYRLFISRNKTERECVSSAIKAARAAGYVDLAEVLSEGETLNPGDKIYASNRGKSLMLVQLGTEPLENGVNILGAHVDSPRLDIKQNPVYESSDLAYLDTHYYGGLKPTLWVATPLAVHGVFAKKDGTVVHVAIGEDANDPVFCISDILIHLAAGQLDEPLRKAVEAEKLDLIVGGKPVVLSDDAGEEEKKDPVKQLFLQLLNEKYGVEEDDLLSAELEVVPAGPARDMGLDRSMILGYGQDDRVCAYTSLIAQLETESVSRTAVTLLVDKEEIGSVGHTGMTSLFFENTMAEILALADEGSDLALRRCLANSRMLSSDVSAGYDPNWEDRFEKKNAAFLGHGLCFNKFTGHGGKAGSNDADAEYVALVRDIMDKANVSFQTCELGRVDVGGGGTIAYILARYGMDVIDSGVPVLSMHSLWEVSNKADIYEAYRGYKAFLRRK